MYFLCYFVIVDGGWSVWVIIGSECLVMCGCGFKIRIWLCLNFVLVNGGWDCFGVVYEFILCLFKECLGE